MAIRTTVKNSLKNSLLQSSRSLQLMYPFYFPYENTYYMPQYTSYYSDPNQMYPFFSITQDIKFQEQISKNQQVNTNYSINDCQLKPEVPQQNLAPSEQNPSFFGDKQDFQNNVQNSPKKITINNELKRPHNEKKSSQPRFRYTHKNFESNIINKIFSFLWSQDKSKKYVCKVLKDKTKAALYFDYIKIIRKYCKRYINKEYLLNLCDYQIEHIAYKIVMKQTEKLKYFSLEEFSQTVRKLIFIYLDTVCATSILTSKKMRTDIWREHFQKMRNIKEFMFGRISSYEYDSRMSHTYKEIYSALEE